MNDYQHILLAVDVSQPAEEAASRAATLARQYQAGLTLIYMLPHYPEEMPVPWVPAEEQDPLRYLVPHAEKKLVDLAQRIGFPEARVEVVPSVRSAKHEIVRYAKENGVDLIVVGSHVSRGLGRLLGSTASGVVHGAECDVLTVHIRE